MPRPDRLLIVTVGGQWLVTVGVALAAARTGSLYGDPATAAAAVRAADDVTGGTLPATGGPLYPILLAPVVAATTKVATVASVVTSFNIVVLGPLASYCILALARRIAGTPFAVLAATVWLLAPIAAVPLFVVKYRDVYVDNVLPALYGLTLQPAYLAMALSLAAAFFGLRAADGAPRAALVAGLLAAAAIACLPLAAGVAAGIVLALVVARRWRGLGEAAAGLAIGVVPTLIWRQRALDDALITFGHPSWARFQLSMANVREFFWSNRLLQWLPVAGAIGMCRVAPAAAALTAGWVALATVLGVATAPSFDGGGIFVDLIPAWPAYALLVAAVPALVPTLLRRLGIVTPRQTDASGVRPAVVVVVLAAICLTAALAALVGR